MRFFFRQNLFTPVILALQLLSVVAIIIIIIIIIVVVVIITVIIIAVINIIIYKFKVQLFLSLWCPEDRAHESCKSVNSC